MSGEGLFYAKDKAAVSPDQLNEMEHRHDSSQYQYTHNQESGGVTAYLEQNHSGSTHVRREREGLQPSCFLFLYVQETCVACQVSLKALRVVLVPYLLQLMRQKQNR